MSGFFEKVYNGEDDSIALVTCSTCDNNCTGGCKGCDGGCYGCRGVCKK